MCTCDINKFNFNYEINNKKISSSEQRRLNNRSATQPRRFFKVYYIELIFFSAENEFVKTINGINGCYCDYKAIHTFILLNKIGRNNPELCLNFRVNFKYKFSKKYHLNKLKIKVSIEQILKSLKFKRNYYKFNY